MRPAIPGQGAAVESGKPVLLRHAPMTTRRSERMRFGGIDIDQFFGGYMCRTGVDRIMHEMTIFEINYRADSTG
jgi:hypothetical protein